MDFNYKIIGNIVKEIRLSKGFSQDTLPEKSGLGNRHISQIENAATKLSLSALINLANAPEVTLTG